MTVTEITKNIKNCISVVCIDPDTDKILMVLENQYGENVINLPSGGVEVGEKSTESAVRELREETRMILEPSELLPAGRTTLETETSKYITEVYACYGHNTGDRKISDNDVYEAKWMTVNEIFESSHKFRNKLIGPKINLALDCLRKSP